MVQQVSAKGADSVLIRGLISCYFGSTSQDALVNESFSTENLKNDSLWNCDPSSLMTQMTHPVTSVNLNLKLIRRFRVPFSLGHWFLCVVCKHFQ